MFTTDEWLKQRAGVHRSTISRWRAKGRFPRAIERLAELEIEGRIELVHEAWTGWRIDPRTGDLVTPGGERYRADELVALPIRAQLQHALQAEIERLRRDARPITALRGAWTRLRRFIQPALGHRTSAPKAVPR